MNRPKLDEEQGGVRGGRPLSKGQGIAKKSLELGAATLLNNHEEPVTIFESRSGAVLNGSAGNELRM